MYFSNIETEIMLQNVLSSAIVERKRPKHIDNFLCQHNISVQPENKFTFIKKICLLDLNHKNTVFKPKKCFQTLLSLGFNNNIYHEGNISNMADLDVFSLLKFRKRKSRSHDLRLKGNNNRKMRAVKRTTTSLKDLSKELKGNFWSTHNALVIKFFTHFHITCSSSWR